MKEVGIDAAWDPVEPARSLVDRGVQEAIEGLLRRLLARTAQADDAVERHRRGAGVADKRFPQDVVTEGVRIGCERRRAGRKSLTLVPIAWQPFGVGREKDARFAVAPVGGEGA